MYVTASQRKLSHPPSVGSSPTKSTLVAWTCAHSVTTVWSGVLFGPLAPCDHIRVRIAYRKLERNLSFSTIPFGQVPKPARLCFPQPQDLYSSVLESASHNSPPRPQFPLLTVKKPTMLATVIVPVTDVSTDQQLCQGAYLRVKTVCSTPSITFHSS